MGVLACSRAAPGPSRPDSRARGPDLLRIERFGALYYQRRTATFMAVPSPLARLLAAATEVPLPEAYARLDGSLSFDVEALAQEVVRWRRDGILDGHDRCPARVIDTERAEGALTGPLVTHVQLTRACNLRCTHCYVDTMAKRAPEELTVTQLDALFAELRTLGSPVAVLAGGEPMVRSDLFDILDAVGRHEIDAWLCSNATLVNEDNARRLAGSALRGLSISLDGPDAESHEVLRGEGRYAHALRGIRHLVAAGAHDVQLRVTVTPHNAARLAEFCALATDLGVDKVVFKPFRRSGAATESEELTISRAAYLEAVARAQEAWNPAGCPADFADGLPDRAPAWTHITPAFGCVGGTTSASITWDGRVVGCGSVLSTGDWTLHHKGFGECWRHAPGVVSWRTLEAGEGCQSCERFSDCGGGCRARALGEGRSIREPDPFSFCSAKSEAPARRVLPILA